MHVSSAVCKALCVIVFGACGVLLQGCSTFKLAYNQVPHLAYWQLNSYLDLADTQTERVRDELSDLHQWHREKMLPQHAELLQTMQQQLSSSISPEQACGTYGDIRVQFNKVLTQAEPKLLWLASQLSENQIRHLQKKHTKSNTDWRKEWVDVNPEKLREQKFKQLLSRAETFYGPLQAPQKAALNTFIDRSVVDPQRTYAERLRRQKDLVQVLQKIAEDRTNTERTRTLIRGYFIRFNESPDLAYQSYAQEVVNEGCEGFSLVHNAMTAAQKLKAVQSVKGYEQDFFVLTGR